jgi:hypothetical protein
MHNNLQHNESVNNGSLTALLFLSSSILHNALHFPDMDYQLAMGIVIVFVFPAQFL